jgi:thymidine kinase
MAKLYFTYATMGSGKSGSLLQVDFNYRERGKTCLLLTARLDDRYGVAKIASRMGLSAEAQTFTRDCDLMEAHLRAAAAAGVACVLIDEAQFLTRAQVEQLVDAVDHLGLPVMAYGLRVDFQGNLFEGSAALMALSDELREMRTICADETCNSKATMVLRMQDGKPTFDGDQVQIGGNETYVPVCRTHWFCKKMHG